MNRKHVLQVIAKPQHAHVSHLHRSCCTIKKITFLEYFKFVVFSLATVRIVLSIIVTKVCNYN